MDYRKISELKKLPNNPRVIKDRQFKTLCESIKNNPEYFEARPLILSDRTGEFIVLAGNQRYEAAKYLKLKTVPTYLIPGLTEEKEREIIIRDNVANGEWDFDVLASEWSDIPLEEWGVDLPVQKEPEEINIVPPKDPNILVRLSFHPGVWIGKRDEIFKIFEQMKKTYGCEIKIEE